MNERPGYFGYLASLSYATDMFETVFSSDPMSRSNGLKYRREILKPGGSVDEMKLLENFLGRKPSNEAFLKQLLGST